MASNGCIKPSGVFCQICDNEIDLFDGPVRRIGKPQQFACCWQCLREILNFLDVDRKKDILTEDVNGELHIWLEDY